MPGGTLTGGRLGRLFPPMCGRYAREVSDEELVEIFKILREKQQSEINYDVKPGTPVSSIRLDGQGQRELVGLPWMWIHPKYRHFNAKGENVRRYPAYRESFASRRCLVPATGYYEWMKVSPKVKQRYYIERNDGKLMAFAGLYSEDSTMMATITVPPNAEVTKIHDRLPVFIEEKDWERYLDPEPLTDEEKHRMIATPPDGYFKFWPVANLALGADLKREIKVMPPQNEKPKAVPQPDLFG